MTTVNNTFEGFNSTIAINNAGIASELDLTVKVRVFCPIISKMLYCI